MKHSWRSIAAFALAALMIVNCLPVTAMAQDAADFTIDGNSVLTAYTGSSSNVTIPDGVQIIGNGTDAVFGVAVESVTIPAGVTEIAANAFSGCTGLKCVTFAGNSQLTKIGQEAFYAVNQLQDLAIPEGVTEIGKYAFAAMSALETITLPSTLETVCDEEWFGNLFARGTSGGAPESLTEVNIAEGNPNYISYDGVVYSADGKNLIYCPAQKSSIQWSEAVETIDTYAFNKSAMQTITLPDTLRTIDDYAFYSSKLTALSTPAALETIGAYAFYNTKIKSVAFAEGLQAIKASAFGECYFPEGTIIEIPASVTSVGGYAFDCLGDMGAASVKVLGSDTELASGFIPNYAKITLYGAEGSTAQKYAEDLGSGRKLTFQLLSDGGETAVESIELPETLTLTVGESTQLTATVLPEAAAGTSLTWLVDQAEPAGCITVTNTGLVTATAAGSATVKVTSENGVSASCQVTAQTAQPAGDFEIQQGVLIAYTGSDKSVTIPDTVTVIGNGTDAVFGSQVETVTIPASVTEIAPKAFYYCMGLKTVSFAPDSQLKTIGAEAFSTASAIQSLEIPEGVTSIGAQAFVNTHQLKSISLPASLSRIGSEGDHFAVLFAYSRSGNPTSAPSALTEVNIADGNPNYISYDGAVYNADGKNLVYCPAQKSLIQWKDGVETIGAYAFYKSAMHSLTIPGTVVSIGKSAFSGTQFTSLELPASVKTVEASAFFNSRLTNVVLSEGLERIEANAFSQSHVAGVTIPASVTYVGENAFDFEYGTDYYIRLLGANTELADEFIPYYYPIVVYGQSGSTAEQYVTAKKADKGDKCKLTFQTNGLVEPTGISLDQDVVTLSRTGSVQLKATLTPEGAQGTVAWSSGNTSVATVSSTGLVTAVQPGSAVITAKVGTYSATCTVTVAVAEGESDYLIGDDGQITGYLGTDWTNLEIPQTVNGTQVTGITAGAFQGQTAIETVTLPASVTSIGASAFAGCSKLRSINLEQITNLGQSAFSQCTALTTVQLGEGLTRVPESAFSGCLQLASVTLPSTVKELDKEAFYLCTSLQSLTLPEGLTAIHAGALLGCPLQALHLPSTLEQMGDEYMGDVFEEAGQTPADTTLTHITVAESNPLYSADDGLIYNKAQTELLFCPRGRVTAEVKEGVTAIGPYAFFMCFDLTSVILPSTLKTVKEQAFHYCEALTDCTLPDGLERVENSGFFGCESWAGVDNIPDSVQYIGPYAFAECKGSRLVIPEGITRIEEFAFWGYEDGLTEILLPSTLTSIGSSAFAWAKDVTSLTIPEGVTSIGEQAFGRMDSLQSLTLPSTLTKIGANAFMGSKAIENKLTEVYISSGVTTIGANAFADRGGLTIVADSEQTAAAQYALANGLTLRLKSGETVDPDFEIENGVLVAYHGTDSEVVIPEGVTEIGEAAFASGEEGEGGVDLKKVTIPASVTKIGTSAFEGCALTEVIFAEGSQLQQIGSSAFAYCTKLPEITLPDTLVSIGAGAFCGDSQLGEIQIPASVISIGDDAFNTCYGLQAVTFASDLDSQLETIGARAFYQCYRLKVLDIPEGVTTIGNQAFRVSQGLKRVYLPASLTQLGTTVPAVFLDLTSLNNSTPKDLTEITVAEGNPVYSSHDGLVYSADGKTLLYCPTGKIGTVTVQDGTEIIAANAFRRSMADHVVLPESLQTIEGNAFIGSSLSSVEIPDAVEQIGSYAFYYCQKLETVHLGQSVKTIADNAFGDLTPVANLTLPASVQRVGESAFEGLSGYLKVESGTTELAGGAIPYYSAITVYAEAGSTAEAYVNQLKADKGDSCKLAFQPISDFTQVTGITLSSAAFSLKQRETASLTAEIAPQTATNQVLVYKSLNSAVATVDASGTITALQPGQAVIRVLSADGPYADCTVTVIRDESISDFTIDQRGYITGYTGTDTDLVIPETVDGTAVKGIAQGAFQNNWDIQSVSFPSGLDEIEADAFQKCGSLVRVQFAAGLQTIGERAFAYCTHLTNVELPEGLTTMGANAFGECERLESVKLPGTLRQIPEGAFYICWRLKEMEVPEGVEQIGKDAFYECEGMERLTLPTSLRTIDEGAFAACVRLTEVTIPEGVVSLGKETFMSCTALVRIHLPATLQTMGAAYPGDVFENTGVLGCNHLETVTVTEGSAYFSSQDGLLYNADGTELLFCPRGRTTASVQKGTERIGDYAFFYCRVLEEVSLPDTLKVIGANSFSICDSLTEVSIPSGVETIGESAFSSDAALTKLTLPNTVKEIGAKAFLNTGLVTLEIPGSVQSLGAQALAYNTALTSVTIPSSVTQLGAELFLNSDSVTVYTDSTNAPIYAYAKANGIAIKTSGSHSSGSGSTTTTYAVGVGSTKNGSVSVSPKNASKGDTVTIVVKPDTGYTVETLTVKDASGKDVNLTRKSDTVYTFTMPGSKVNVAASFMEDNAILNYFVDVPASAYYHDAVLWAVENGITSGTTATTFSPNMTCTRAQAVTFLWRAAGSPEPKNTGMAFTDIPATAYYYEAVLWAIEQGVTQGTSNTTFSPNATCTRAQIVTFLYRAEGSPAAAGHSFSDVNAADYYNAAVGWASDKGVTSGTGDDRFSPSADCTRAQIVTFLYRSVQ